MEFSPEADAKTSAFREIFTHVELIKWTHAELTLQVSILTASQSLNFSNWAIINGDMTK